MNEKNKHEDALTLIPEDKTNNFLELNFGKLYKDVKTYTYNLGILQIENCTTILWQQAKTKNGTPFVFPYSQTETVLFEHFFTEISAQIPACLAGLICTGGGVAKSLALNAEELSASECGELVQLHGNIIADQAIMADALDCLQEYLSIITQAK